MKTIIAFGFAALMSAGSFASSFDSHHGGGHGHGGHGHGGHGHGHREVVCRVVNLRGMTFQARGDARRAYLVSERAMNKCNRSGSRVCIPVGCSRY